MAYDDSSNSLIELMEVSVFTRKSNDAYFTSGRGPSVCEEGDDALRPPRCKTADDQAYVVALITRVLPTIGR